MTTNPKTRRLKPEDFERLGSWKLARAVFLVPPGKTGQHFVFYLLLHDFWEIFKALASHQDSRDSIAYMLKLGGRIGLASLERTDIVAINQLNEFMDRLVDTIGTYAIGDKANDHVRAFSYTLLRTKIVTRESAYIIASDLLPDVERPPSSEAWRKAVDRWASDKKRRLPAIEERKRGK